MNDSIYPLGLTLFDVSVSADSLRVVVPFKSLSLTEIRSDIPLRKFEPDS